MTRRQKGKWEEYLLAFDSLLLTQHVKLFGFQRSKTILLLSQSIREANHGNSYLHGARTNDVASVFRGNTHGPTDQRPILIETAPSIVLQCGAGTGRKPFEELINVFLRPLLDEIIPAQSWRHGGERPDLLHGGALNPLAMLIRKHSETALNFLLIQNGHGK